MKGTPTGFQPDPNKWINTNSKPKAPAQRPLIALRHGFSTPTSSRLSDTPNRLTTPGSTMSAQGRSTGNGKEKQKDEQATMTRFLTPPATFSAKPAPKRALERIRREVEEATRPTHRSSGERTDKNIVKERDDWGSDDGPGDQGVDQEVAGPSRRSRTRSPDVVDLTTPSSSCSPLSTRSAESPSKPLDLASQVIPIPSSNLQSKDPKRQTPQRPPDRPITPIPPSIMAMHQHLCGRDFIKKPKELPLPRSQAKKRDIDNRVYERSRREAGGTDKELVPLVQLSSDQPEEDDGPSKVLSPLRTNTMRSRHRRGGSVVETSKRSRIKALARAHTTRIEPYVSFRMDDPQAAVHSDQLMATPTSPAPIRSSTPAPPTPTRSVTPRKHHQITPPKSRPERQLHEQAETLFALPPPPQPNFGISPVKVDTNRTKRRSDWNAVEMNPETLLTWSLGGSEGQTLGQGRPQVDVASEGITGVGTIPQNAAQLGPNPMVDTPSERQPHSRVSPKRPRLDSTSPPESVGPSEPSQSFPILVHSSQPTSDRQTEDRHARTASNHSGPLSRPGDRWSHLDHGILSVPLEHTTPTAKASKKARRSAPNGDSSQSKLAAFGFFPEDTPKATGKSKRKDVVFETAWEDEQDLDPDVDMDTDTADQGATGGLGQHTPREEASLQRLQPVPQAPYHPGLRPAGIRELERRKAATTLNTEPEHSHPTDDTRMDDEVGINHVDVDRASSPPLFEMTPRSSSGPSTTTTPTTSSSVMDDLPGSMGSWWAGLGERDV